MNALDCSILARHAYCVVMSIYKQYTQQQVLYKFMRSPRLCYDQGQTCIVIWAVDCVCRHASRSPSKGMITNNHTDVNNLHISNTFWEVGVSQYSTYNQRGLVALGAPLELWPFKSETQNLFGVNDWVWDNKRLQLLLCCDSPSSIFRSVKTKVTSLVVNTTDDFISQILTATFTGY